MFFSPVNPTRLRWTLSLCVVVVLLSSCSKNEKKQTGKTNSSETSSIDLKSIREAYANAAHYSDEAKVILHYSLNGNPFEEIHPSSLSVDRQGNLHIRRFKLEMAANSNASLARVLDPVSQNLGGQVVCSNATPKEFWEAIVDDAIGYHFFNGADDIPWSDRHNHRELAGLLHIQYSLFSGNPPAWFSQTCLVESKSIEVDGKMFQDAVFNSPLGKIACRFDEKEKLLLGIRFPGTILSDSIASASGVTNVSLAVIFESATFSESKTKSPRLVDHEIALKRFIRLPEEFPSEAIGKTFESWGLKKDDQSEFDPKTLRGAPTLLFYGPPEQYRLAELAKIQELIKRLSYARLAWASPISLPQFPGNIPFTQIQRLADSAGSLYKNVGMNRTVFLLIIDRNGVIQFAAPQDKNWLNDIEAILERIRKGEDVAREMHTEYSKYYSQYQSKLTDAQADASIKNILLNN